MDRNKFIFLVLITVLVCALLSAEEVNVSQNGIVPLSYLFHDFGWNILGSVMHNYGLNFASAGLGTWGFIETGLDWEFRNLMFENQGLAKAGVPGLYSSYILPPIVPVAAYLSGFLMKNERLQIAGLAIAQGFGITAGIQTVFKMTTGRISPGIIDGHGHSRDYRTDDFSTQFDWFNMNFIDGWPSGHTANAFTAAAIIGEIYYDKPLLVAGVYTYAALIAASMSVSVHWISEVFAGVLIGFAVGKTVGKSFRSLMEGELEQDKINFYVLPNSVGVNIRW
jgi:membrane-associated phospholipid phosphatase